MKLSVVASRKAILVRYTRRTIDVTVVLVYGQLIMQRKASLRALFWDVHLQDSYCKDDQKQPLLTPLEA